MKILFQYLFRKTFKLCLGFTATESTGLAKFLTKCNASEVLHARDTKRVFVANEDAGATDPEVIELATMKGNAVIVAPSPTVDMTFNNKTLTVDTNSNPVDFQFADDEFNNTFRMVVVVKDGTSNVSFTRSGSTATINGGSTKSYTTPTAHTMFIVACTEDNKLSVAKLDP